MTLPDVSIVNVAIPSMQADLHLGCSGLQRVTLVLALVPVLTDVLVGRRH